MALFNNPDSGMGGMNGGNDVAYGGGAGGGFGQAFQRQFSRGIGIPGEPSMLENRRIGPTNNPPLANFGGAQESGPTIPTENPIGGGGPMGFPPGNEGGGPYPVDPVGPPHLGGGPTGDQGGPPYNPMPMPPHQWNYATDGNVGRPTSPIPVGGWSHSPQASTPPPGGWGGGMGGSPFGGPTVGMGPDSGFHPQNTGIVPPGFHPQGATTDQGGQPNPMPIPPKGWGFPHGGPTGGNLGPMAPGQQAQMGAWQWGHPGNLTPRRRF